VAIAINTLRKATKHNLGLVELNGDTVDKLADYTALQKQLLAVKPSSTASSAYTVTNTEARSCPTVGSEWSASSKLPPIANPTLCECMVESLDCSAKSGISGNETANLFDYICGQDNAACTGIESNGTTGIYGAYSMCTPAQKLAFVMNKFYIDNNKASTACDFSGNANLNSSPSPASSCSALLDAAGTAGTGTVTAVPTGAGSTSSGAGASATSSKAAAGSLTVPRFDLGLFSLGIYVSIAAMTGAGMVLL
jgi:hypothetical protein